MTNMNYEFEAVYNEILEEMCEDVGINVSDATETLKQMAKEFAEIELAGRS